MANKTLIVGFVVVGLVIAAVWWLSRRQQAKAPLPAAPRPVSSTSGTGGLKAGVTAATSAACATLLASQGAGAAAPACGLVAPLATDVLSQGFSELKRGFGIFG